MDVFPLERAGQLQVDPRVRGSWDRLRGLRDPGADPAEAEWFRRPLIATPSCDGSCSSVQGPVSAESTSPRADRSASARDADGIGLEDDGARRRPRRRAVQAGSGTSAAVVTEELRAAFSAELDLEGLMHHQISHGDGPVLEWVRSRIPGARPRGQVLLGPFPVGNRCRGVHEPTAIGNDVRGVAPSKYTGDMWPPAPPAADSEAERRSNPS